jgi:hypothetical protein
MARKTPAAPVVGPATTATSTRPAEIAAETAKATETITAAVVDRQVAKRDTTLYVSAKPEPMTFDVRLDPSTVVRGYWDSAEERVLWRVPDGLHERFKRHSFITTGRIITA